jgi:hypothetical protein
MPAAMKDNVPRSRRAGLGRFQLALAGTRRRQQVLAGVDFLTCGQSVGGG